MKISQKMIAEYSGVSRGTVDRVLHGKPNVKPETREKVLSAIDELGYSTNMHARALSLSKREYSICVVLPENPFFSDVRIGIDAALKELADYNISVSYIVTNGKTNEEIIGEIDGCDSNAFMIAVGDTPDIRDCIKRKTDENIPVITFNSDVKDCGRMCFVGQNLYKSGRIAASLMLKMLHGDYERILIVTGNNKYKAHRERVQGFADVIKESGRNVEITDVVETNDESGLTRSLVKKVLSRDKELNGIYMASGHVEALSQLLCEYDKKFKVIVNDLYPAVETALKKGIFDFTIFQNPFDQGYMPVKLLFEYLFNKKTPDKEYYFTNNTIITSETL